MYEDRTKIELTLLYCSNIGKGNSDKADLIYIYHPLFITFSNKESKYRDDFM